MANTVNEKTNPSKSNSPVDKKAENKAADVAAKKEAVAAKKIADATAKKEAVAAKKAADAAAKKEAVAAKKAADAAAKKEAVAAKKAADAAAEKDAADSKKAAEAATKKNAAAEKKATKLAERKAAAAEKKAARVAEKAAAEAKKKTAKADDKKAAKADKKPAKATEKRGKKGRKGLAKPPFELSLSINLSRDFDRIMRNAFSEAGKAVIESINGQLTIPPDTKPKAVRELEKLRKSFAKPLEKALIAFGTRTLDSGKIHIKELQTGEDGGNLTTAPMQQVLAPGFAKRHLGLFRSILAGLKGDTPDLKKFADLPASLECPFGTSLENNYFLMGNLSFTPNFDKPKASEVSYAFDLFAKNGKKMGMRLQFSLTHDLSPDNFKNELRVEIPEAGE